ncbi:MAG TPA: CRISPR-associated endonuclease Cas2 [Burkholderiales bacterium]|nr:CRISPR-associated endonuclease Cas2 [Burkholderiales bacterium]
MRQRYIVTYDIADPRRLRKVFKLMKGYGEHLQLSVFRCDLTKMTLAMMKAELNEIIHAQKDQVLIIDVGPTEGRGEEVFESLGKAYVDEGQKPNVV